MPASLAKAYVPKLNVPPKPNLPQVPQIKSTIGNNQWTNYNKQGGTPKPMYAQPHGLQPHIQPQSIPYPGYQGTNIQLWM